MFPASQKLDFVRFYTVNFNRPLSLCVIAIEAIPGGSVRKHRAEGVEWAV